jgi:hypothetical protein
MFFKNSKLTFYFEFHHLFSTYFIYLHSKPVLIIPQFILFLIFFLVKHLNFKISKFNFIFKKVFCLFYSTINHPLMNIFFEKKENDSLKQILYINKKKN